jgi:hypothetical protein
MADRSSPQLSIRRNVESKWGRWADSASWLAGSTIGKEDEHIAQPRWHLVLTTMGPADRTITS